MKGRTWTVPATVLEVVDGDTVRLDLDLGWFIRYTARARIARINAPEVRTPAGDAAKAHARTLLLPGDQVTFTSTALDKYGRPLGALTYGTALAPHDFAATMLADGHAIAYPA